MYKSQLVHQLGGKVFIMKNKIKNAVPYAGKIKDYTYNTEQKELILSVKLVNDDCVYQIKKEVDFSENSKFLDFCALMSLYDYKDTNINFAEFVDLPVVCTLYEDEDGKLQIDFIDFFWECYTDKEDYKEFFRLTDDEMMEFFYGDIFNLYNGNVASNEKQGGTKYEIQKD